MRNLIKKSLLLVTCIISLNLYCQQNEYPIQKVNGVDCYVYTVKPKEGIYRISKKFDVSQEDLNKFNPQLQDELKIGQQVFIPIIRNKQLKKQSVNTVENQHGRISGSQIMNEITEHKVESKETIYGICRKYNITQEALLLQNPELKDGLRVGMIIKIPKEKGNSTISQSKKSSISTDTLSFISHKVQPGETLYALSKLYQIKIEDITTDNPQLSHGESLKNGENLKIRQYKSKKQDKESDKSSVANKAQQKTATQVSTKKIVKNSLKVAFLLPFMLENKKIEGINEKIYDFYSGALTAIKDAKSNGISIEVFTFDTDKNEENISEILKNNDLKLVDLIIGPAFTNQISDVSQFARENKVFTLIPFSAKSNDVLTNPYLLQFNPRVNIESKFIKNLLQTNYIKHNIIFADIQGVNPLDQGLELKEDIKSGLEKQKRKFQVVQLKPNTSIDLSNVIDKNTKNIIIFNTDKYSLVSPFFEEINKFNQSNEILLYEQYSWLSQNNDMFDSFSISPFKAEIAYTDSVQFSSKFNNLFNWQASAEAPRYDMLGYDLTQYFITQLSYGGGSKFFSDKLKLPVGTGTQSDLKFERANLTSGFINQKLFLIEKKQTKRSN